MELYKYQGAGNDFLLADNRDGGFKPDEDMISRLCDRHYGVGADGVMLLENDPDHDFKMVFHNPDGTGGMMCGNGGRCIVALADDLGISPKNGKTYEFLADDGPHSAEILDIDHADNGKSAKEARNFSPTPKTIRLKMRDVTDVKNIDVKSYFLDTGTRHFVRFVSGLQNYDVLTEGRKIRNLPQFAPVGTNVNFVEATDGVLNVRTYEKGVEDETCACGTGITASAIASLRHFGTNHNFGDRVRITVKALRDELVVDFIGTPSGAENVWLTGPATFVCKVMLCI